MANTFGIEVAPTSLSKYASVPGRALAMGAKPSTPSYARLADVPQVNWWKKLDCDSIAARRMGTGLAPSGRALTPS